jgi:hypothetical protein
VTVGNPTTSGGITGLAFDNSTGTSGSLWGSQGFGFNTTSTLIKINPNTGALINDVSAIHTNAGDVAGSSISIDDLAFNSTNNTLYAITSDAAAPGGPVDGIYTVHTGTGLATLSARRFGTPRPVLPSIRTGCSMRSGSIPKSARSAPTCCSPSTSTI